MGGNFLIVREIEGELKQCFASDFVKKESNWLLK